MATCNSSKANLAAENLVAALDSRFFKALGEPVRVDILKFLLLQGCCDIGTIAENMPQDRSVISRHLGIMHDAGLLICEKRSRHIYYELNSQFFLEKAKSIVEQIEKCISVCCPCSK